MPSSRLGTRRQARILQDANRTDSAVRKEADSESAPKRTRPIKSPEKSEIKKTPLKSALRAPSKGILLPAISSTPLPSEEPSLKTPAIENSRNNDVKLETPIRGTPATPKREVRFAEPLAVAERVTVAPQSSPKFPIEINVRNNCYRVLNVLGTGGSCVVYLVRFQ